MMGSFPLIKGPYPILMRFAFQRIFFTEKHGLIPHISSRHIKDWKLKDMKYQLGKMCPEYESHFFLGNPLFPRPIAIHGE
jgi:hypothetical protein